MEPDRLCDSKSHTRTHASPVRGRFLTLAGKRRLDRQAGCEMRLPLVAYTPGKAGINACCGASQVLQEAASGNCGDSLAAFCNAFTLEEHRGFGALG
jgi:hypothetical protein